MYGLPHRALEKGDKADTINLQGSALTAKAKPALGRGEATAGAERRSEEFDVASALVTQPAANFAAADAAQRKQQIKEGSLKEGKVCACRGQILYPSALHQLKHIGKIDKASGRLSDWEGQRLHRGFERGEKRSTCMGYASNKSGLKPFSRPRWSVARPG